MAFRILNQFPVYLDHEGRPASGGWLAFYESGTDAEKDVYGDPDLSTNNGVTVELDSDGRTTHDVWGDGAYRVRLYDADGTLLAEADDVEVGGGDAQAIPPLQTGRFLTNNGAVLQWANVRELPDPTGQDGKMLVADGSSAIWQPLPETVDPPKPDIEVDSGSVRIGAGGATSWLQQIGSGSAGASGTKSTTANVTFPEPFAATPKVFVVNTSGFVTQRGTVQPTVSVTNRSTTGFTVTFGTETGEGNSDNNITSPVNFDWLAVGTVATPSDDPPVTPA